MRCFFSFIVLLLGSCCLASPDPERIAKAYREIQQREKHLDRNTTFAHFRTSQPDLKEQPAMTALPYHPLALRLRDQLYELPEVVALARTDPDGALQVVREMMEELPERQQMALNKLPFRMIGGERPIVNNGTLVLPPELRHIIDQMALRSHMCEKLGLPQGTSNQALLGRAVDEAQYELIDYLIWLGADPNHIDDKGNSLLLRGIEAESEAVVERLLFYGADKSYKTPPGYPLLVPAIMLNLPLAHWFFNSVDAHYKLPGGVPLTYYTATIGDIEMTRRLSEAGVDTTWVSGADVPLLCSVASLGKTEMVKFLIEEQHADPNSQSLSRSCLWYAVDMLHRETVHVLLEAGADANQMAPLFTSKTLLQYAIWLDDHAIARDLVAHGAHIDAESGSILLGKALFWSDMEALRLLLQRGVDPNHSEKTSLLLPLLLRRWDVASLMVEHGANPNGQIGISSRGIHHHPFDSDQIIWLVRHGADLNKPGYLGETWLQQALHKGDDALIDTLLEHGAKVSASSRLALIKRGFKKLLK